MGKDLTKVAPVSPRKRIAGFALLPRTIDKCRALLWGKIGEYEYDCPFDNVLFKWKGIKGDDLKEYISHGHTDTEIGEWVKTHGVPRTNEEIQAWSDRLLTYRLEDDPEDHEWLKSENLRLGLPENASLMNMLEADDKEHFGR